MNFLKDKQFLRFLIISSLLIVGAIGAALIAAAAGQTGDYEIASFASKAALALSVGIMVYVVPRLARNVRLEYLQSGLALNVMSAGWLFCAFILVVVIAAISTGNNLLYMVLAALLSTMVISGIASRLSIGDVSVSLRFPDHIFAGDPTQLEITLSNQKRLFPSFSLTVAATQAPEPRRWRRKNKTDLTANSLGDLAHFAIVPARAKARMFVTRTFEKRGVYQVHGFNIRTRFPFGFVERTRFVEANGEIIIYPRPQPLDDSFHLLPLTHGQMESDLKGNGSDLYAIRQYTPSDHPRYVDWKATAKTSRLMVREYTRDDDWRVTIALDSFDEHTANASSSRASATVTPALPNNSEAAASFAGQFETAVTFTASLVTHFLAEGAEVRLLTADFDSGFGRDNDHRYAMLRQLARIHPLADTRADNAEAPVPLNLLGRIPALAEEEFKIVVTAAERGSIPTNIWRSSHVVYFDDLQ